MALQCVTLFYKFNEGPKVVRPQLVMLFPEWTRRQ
jgi:hypothetical protein